MFTSLCTAAPPLKRIRNFFEGRGGCTQATCPPDASIFLFTNLCSYKPELNFFKGKRSLKIDRSVKIPWHSLDCRLVVTDSCIPANSHALCVSLTPADLNFCSRFVASPLEIVCPVLKSLKYFYIFGYLRKSSGNRQHSSEVFGNLRRSFEVFWKFRQSSNAVDNSPEIQVLWRRKISCILLTKSWQVYF